MAQVPALFRNDGDTHDYTPASTAVVAGDVILIGTIPMVAKDAIAVAARGVLSSKGTFKCPKDSSTFADGDAVYWNATGNPVGGTAGTGAMTSTPSTYLAGYVDTGTTDGTYSGALTGDATVRVNLTAAKRTSTLAGSVTADDISGSDSSLGIAGQNAAQGGAVALVGGTSSTGGNAGGAITHVGGTPGVTGIGGAVTSTGGAGGATSGAGGAVTNTGGAGTNGNAAGGLVSNAGGAGQGSAAGGLSKIVGGVGGATGAGGAVQMTGGAGGGTSGTGGAATIAAGAAQGTTAVGGAASLTGGASAGASGTAGACSVDAGAATGGTGAPVNIADVNASACYLSRGPLKALQVGLTLTSLGTTQSSAPTSAQLLGGILTQTGSTGAGVVTLPTGTALSTACARTPVVGDTFDCYFYNLGGSQTLTITGQTGTTVVGTAAVGTGKMAQIKFYNSGSNAWNCYVIVSA